MPDNEAFFQTINTNISVTFLSHIFVEIDLPKFAENQSKRLIIIILLL
jgi:hypothetical protein